jgi:hypothetical protein
MSFESFGLTTSPIRPHLPSPIESNDSDQSEILRLLARPGSRLSANSNNSSSSSVERLNRPTTEYPSHVRMPFKFAVNEDRFLQELPTPVPR